MTVQARSLFLLFFFGAQVLGICWGIGSRAKYFNWVPYDEIAHYHIRVQLRGDTLSEAAIEQRYRKSARGRENRDIDNLLSLIRQYETSYGATDQARVQVTYRINGREEYIWRWPE